MEAPTTTLQGEQGTTSGSANNPTPPQLPSSVVTQIQQQGDPQQVSTSGATIWTDVLIGAIILFVLAGIVITFSMLRNRRSTAS